MVYLPVVDNVTKDTDKAKVDHIDDDDEPTATEDTDKVSFMSLPVYQSELVFYRVMFYPKNTHCARTTVIHQTQYSRQISVIACP